MILCDMVMNRNVFCPSCSKENQNLNIALRMMTDNDKILFDELRFDCWNCKSNISVRIEEPRFKDFTNTNTNTNV